MQIFPILLTFKFVNVVYYSNYELLIIIYRSFTTSEFCVVLGILSQL